MAIKRYLAYTLLEALVTVAVIGSVATGAYVIVSHVSESSSRTKLEQDVKAVNRAIQLYIAHGGNIPAGVTGDEVLARLRREAANPHLAGLKGSLIDPRMTIRWQSSGEASSSSTRAYWDGVSKKFYLAATGSNAGVKEFYSGDLPAPLPMVTDAAGNTTNPNLDTERKTTQEFATVDKWVWDYSGNYSSPRETPNTVPTAGIDPATGEPQTSGNAIPLDPPLFSVASGNFPVTWFPGSVALSIPPSAPATVAEVFYHVTGGPWQRYEAPVAVDVGATLTAKTVSLDPDHWEDSVEASQEYHLIAMKLEITAAFPRSSYNYLELGGPMQGAASTPAPPFGTVNVTNLASTAPEHISSSKFQIYWTFDGSDPASPTSTTRIAGGSFSGTYPGTQLPVTYTGYSPAGAANIRVKAVALDSELYITSDEKVLTLSADKITLPGTTFSVNSQTVVMTSVQDSTRLPVGSRIFYTANGPDPGDNNGEPAAASAVQYLGPVTASPNSLTEYNARTYPPAALKPWFTTGAPGTAGTGTTPDGFYFAVGGGGNTLYQFDDATGNSIIRSSECLFAPATLAFLADTARVYYIEKAAGSWNLGRYDLATGTHSPSGQLTAAGFDYTPGVQPKNLVGYNSSLYYIAEDTDDLVRVDLNTDGTIRAQYKFADIAEDLIAFHAIGDVAADASGTLYISSQNAWASYNLKSLTGFTVPVSNPTWVWAGLVAGSAGQLFGVRDTEPDKFYTVNPITGAGSTPVVFSPPRSFEDFAGPLSNIPFQLPPGHFALSPGSDDILRLNLDSGRQHIFASNIGMNPWGLAADNAGGMLYAVGPDPADPVNVLLKRVSVATGAITAMGDLNDITLPFRPSGSPSALTWYSGSLYYIAPGSSELIKIVLSGDSVQTQIHVSDILDGVSIHPILGTVDALTIGPDGLLYIASSDNHMLVSYDIANLGGFNVIKSSANASYKALTYRADQQMFGVPATDASTTRQLFKVDDNTGAQVFAKNVIPSVDISDITGLFDGAPTPVNSEYFAVNGISTRIYRFDPATGLNSVLTSAAPWAMGAVAYDGENQRVYYLQRFGTLIGAYSIATGTHTIVGDLNASGLTVRVSTFPENLTFFNGSLYCVPPNTDDLMRIDLNQSNTIADVWKEADINSNVPFTAVGDLAVDASGMLYLSDGSVLARFDMKTLSGYTVINNTLSSYFDSLFSAGGTSLYGLTAASPINIVAVNMADGTTTAVSTTSPARNFIDAASSQGRVTVTPAGGAYYASATGKNEIYSINLTTGSLRPVTASCPVAPEALAFDNDNNLIYYTEAGASGSNIGLYKYDLSSQRHTFVGNLGASGLGYSITASPHNLVYFAGNLYCIPAGDDLVRLNFTGGILSSLTKFADVSGNTKNIGNAGAFAVDNTGIAWVSSDTTNLLGKFNFYTRSGYTDVNTIDAKLTGLVFSPANALYGTYAANQNIIQTIDQPTGNHSTQANTSPSLNIRDITGLNSRPQPPLPECYAVGGNNTNIYRFDPATGVTYIVTSAAPFNLSALARDPVNNVLYYIENVSSSWRLGRYTVSTNTHQILGTIGNGAWNYPVVTRPENLFFYDNQLYYIVPGSDDLVQIGLNAGGTAVTGVTKAADITDDTVNLGNVGDVAVDSSGRAWIATGNFVVGQFSMVTLSGYTQLSSGQPNYNSLLFNSSGTFYGSHSGGDTKIYTVNSSTGGATLSADTFPQVTFWDMAGNETSVPYTQSNSLWAISENNGRLGEFLNWNLPNVSSRNYGVIKYYNGGSPTSFSGEIQVESLAITQGGTAYFVRNVPTTVNGISYKRALFSFETSSLVYSATPTVPVATFLGDLESAFSVLGPVGETTDVDHVYGLAIGPDQRLWVLYSEGDGTTTDYLFRINSFSTNAAGALNNVSIIGALTGAGESVTSGQDLTFSGNTLYVTDDTDDKIYTVDRTTAAITGVMSSEANSMYEAMTVFPPTGELVAANTESGNSIAETIRRVRAGANNDTTRFNYLSLSGGNISDIEGLSFLSGTITGGTAPPAPYYAVSRSNTIYTVDPTNGLTTILTASAPFTLDALAYDGGNNVIYYVQNNDTNIQLGKYALSTGVHTVLGDLKTAGAYHPVTHPQHLIYYYGDLFYISGNASNQTYLIKVSLNASAITTQDAITRLSNSASWNVTAAALDNAGLMYFREGTNLRSYDLRRLGNLTTVTTTSAPYEGLLFTSASGTFFGSRTSALSSAEPVNVSTGAGGTPLLTSPAVSLYDMAGTHSAPAPLGVNTNYYAIGGNNQEIYAIDTTTGFNSIKTTTPLFGSIGAIAANPTGDKAYYIQQGSPYTLAVYNRATGLHTQLAQLANVGTLRPTSQPDNLMWFNGSLYWLQSNTDNLIKIELKPDGTYSDTFLAADIAGDDDTAFGTVGDLAVDANGWMYISGTARFAKFNLSSLSGYTTLALNPSFVWSGLMIDADGLSLYGVRNSEPGNLYSVNPVSGNGTLIGAFNAIRNVTDLASPQVPVSTLLTGQRYFISQNSTSVSRIDLATGRSYRITSQIPYQPTSIAHDFTNNCLYLTGYTGASALNPGTIRLLSYNLSTGAPADLASLSTGWTYSPARMPLAMVYAQNALYYIPPQSDDLVKVTLTGNVPTAQDKVADVAANANLGEVDALTITPDGAMYISRSDDHLLSKYNLSSLSGYSITRAAPKANYKGLTYDDSGVLHGIIAGEESSLYTINTTNGFPTFKVATTSPIYDITGLNTAILPAFSRSLWAISRNGTNNQLIEIKNYDQSATRTKVVWGDLQFNNGSVWTAMPNSSIQIYGLALSSSGVGYFVATGNTTISGTTYNLPLFKLDLGTLQTGVLPRVTFLGGLAARLNVLSPPSSAGTEGRWVTGMTIDPGSGKLYGMLHNGDITTADTLFTINSLQLGSGNTLTDLSIVGSTSGGSASVVNGKSLMFDRDGSLLAADYPDYTVDKLNPATAADLGTWSSSNNGNSRFSAMAVDPVNGTLIGAEFSTLDVRNITAGPANDSLAFNLSTDLGIGAVYGMSFLTWPVVLPATPPTVYYAVNGTTTLYSFSANSGATTPLAPVAPFAAKSLAFDPQNRILYYIENVATGFRLAKFDLASSTHTIMGNLDTGSWSYDPSSRPNNLEYSGGSLYYVHPNTDDLVRIIINGNTITDQVKVADLTANTSTFGGGVTELTIGGDGMLWISAVSGLYKYNLSLLTGFTTVSTGSDYAGVFFDQSGIDLYGTTFSAQTAVHSVNQSTGAITAIAATVPTITFEDFGAYPPVPTTPVGTYYAVNGTRTLYVVDQLSGGVSAANGAAPYNMSAVCFDVDNNLVYYVQAGTDTWSLGRYNPVTGVHTDMGRAIETGTYASPSGPQPNNLFVFNSQVYYIKPGTDDLMRIDFSTDGNSLLLYYKVADITGNATTFASVGDVAVASNGIAYFATPSLIGKFDLKSMSSYQVVTSSPGADWKALLMGADSQLYGVQAAQPTKIYRISQTNGTATFVADVSAGLQFTDFAGRHPRVAPQPVGTQVYMAIASSPSLFVANVTTSVNRLVSSSAPFNVDAVAYDYDGYNLYYTEYSDTSFRLGKYDLRTNRHTTVADLKTGWSYNASARINNLIYSNGDLYYIHKNTDDLIRVSLNNGAVSGQSLFANITNDTKSLGDVGALAIDDNGYLYLSRQDATLFARYNMARRSRYTELNTTTAQFNAMVFFNGTLYATRTAQNDRISSISATTGAVLTTSGQSSPVAAMEELSWITPEFTTPSTRYYASDRSSMIYQVDPVTGETIEFASVDPLTAEGIAYDVVNDYIYYLEAPGNGFRLARYDADAKTNTVLGSLQQPGFVYSPADQPKSLVCYNGQIYYIARNSDDLVRITVTGNVITEQVKIADISANASSFDVSAMALNNSGLLYFCTGAKLYRCDLRTYGGSLTLLTSSSPAYESLLFSEDSTSLYGTQSATLTRIDAVNSSNGTATTGPQTNPSVNIYAMTGPNSAPAPVAPFYYATNGTSTLYRIDPTTGVTTALSGAASYTFDTIAYDQTAGIVYYVQNTDTSTKLGKYVISTGTFTNIGQFIDNTWNGLTVASRALHLVAYQGALYYIRTSATTSEQDDLIRITFSTAGAIAAQEKIADINANNSPGNVTAAAVDDTGMMYFSTSTSTLCRYDLRNLTGYTVLKTGVTPLAGLIWRRENGTFYGVQSANATKISTVSMSTGAFGTLLTSSPLITMTDTVGGNMAPPPPWNAVPSVYIAGDFLRTSDSGFRNIAKISPDGTLDTSFNTGTGTNSGSTVRGMTRTSGGKVVIGGDFLSVNGTGRIGLARLNGDGSLDTTFTPDIALAAGGTTGTPYVADWSTLGFNQDIPLSGADTLFVSSSSPLHGMSTSGGFNGFGYQTFNNVGGSGVAMTAFYSQNMTETGGTLDGTLDGPDLFGPTGSGALGGVHPDRRIVGAWSMRFNNDQTGTLTPATVGLSFSEDVFLNQMILGGLSQIAGAATTFGANLLTNGSFENGTWGTSTYFPSTTWATKKPAIRNITSSLISNWSPDKCDWITDSTRATDGSRFLYILPSDQSWNYCVGQNLSVGGSAGAGRQLVTGHTYRVQYSCVAFNPNYPTGVGATTGKPAVEYGWTTSTGTSGFAELFNVREDSTGLPASQMPAANWDALVWRNYTGYFVAPAVSTSAYNMTLWLSMVKTDGATAALTSGMLFDNVRVQEVTGTANAFENAYVRAYSTPDGTGTPVAADTYANLSAQTTQLLGSSSDPITTADINNVRMDNDTSNFVYHTIGMGPESENRYGRIQMSWANQPIRSLAISFWASGDTEPFNSATPIKMDTTSVKVWTAVSNSNPSPTDVAATVGYLSTLTLLYKQNAADSTDTGTYASSYATSFDSTSNAQNATLTYTGGAKITENPVYLLVKGGAAPAGGYAQYIYDISGWNRSDTLNMRDYWPSTSSISHISIYGGTATTPPPGLPKFDGALTSAGVTASLSNLTFRRAASLPGSVWAVAEQADGKLVIGGHFTKVNGVTRKNIARLNADGTLDTSFDPGTGPDADVQTIEITDTGAILAGGDFATWNGSSAGAKAVLLTSTGGRDTSWSSPFSVAATDTVKWIKATTAGVYVGGKFSTPANGIARVSLSGANDTTFIPGTGVGTATVTSGLVLDDGKVIIGGDFTSVNGTSRSRIAKLTTAGAVDTTFAPSGFNAVVNAMLRLPGSGYAHAGGAFTGYNSNTRAKVTVFNSVDGSAGTTIWGPVGMTMNAVYCIK